MGGNRVWAYVRIGDLGDQPQKGGRSAGAATPACGTGCMTVSNKDFGTGYVAAVSGGAARIGQRVKLSPAANTST